MSGLTGAYKFMRGAKRALIPGETAAGQLSMLPSAFGRTTKAAPSAAKVHKELMGMIAKEYAATPPFKASRLAGTGDPRAQVTGLARQEELAMKRKTKKQRMPKPGQVVPYTAPKRYGPNTRSEQRVDDLFGV